MIFRHPNCHHTYPKPDSVRYSLAYSHNSYSIPQILLVLYVCTCFVRAGLSYAYTAGYMQSKFFPLA